MNDDDAGVAGPSAGGEENGGSASKFGGKFGAGKPTEKKETTADRIRESQLNDQMDAKFGFERRSAPGWVNAWLLNIQTTEILDTEKRLQSAVDYYFLEEDGGRFKVSMPFQPYFYILANQGAETEVMAHLSKKFAGTLAQISIVSKEDLDLDNHLTGLRRTYLKLCFANMTDLMKVRKDIMPIVRKNRERLEAKSDYSEMLASHYASTTDGPSYRSAPASHMENIVDIREYDVPYHVRVSIDLRVFVGLWYRVQPVGPDRVPVIQRHTELVVAPDPVILAFDIETTKLPLKFPDSAIDQIMMISYMIDGDGYLIINRQVVAEDIEDFEYTPKPDFQGQFTVFNEEDEKALLIRFFEHIQDVRPHIFVTYNGDFFDWPFVEARAAIHQLNMTHEIGFAKDSANEYKARQCIHMDAFRWVKRDSYLPVGSQNLKATTKAKLRYDPVEVDPEDMCRMAREQPQQLANYSVSDAVATYYLYMKYVHPFIFALCTIIPMQPDEVLRKGSGTLCEALLMVEAFAGQIVFPNKQIQKLRPMSDDGHLIDTETYVGGHVEALESGVFRADIPCRFRLVPAAFQHLIDGVERTLAHEIEHEMGLKLSQIANFEEICEDVKATLEELRDTPARLENPIIYHLDVGAMYPNIILTNRLQPPAIIDERVCAACDFNRPGETCQRKMDWMWRGELIPASRNEYHRILQQLENEKFPSAFPGGPPRAFHQMSRDEQAVIEKKRVQEYCKKAYKRLHETRTELRQTTICQRENSFYVDTVRAFRDRRYEYKGLLKVWKKKLSSAQDSGDAAVIKEAKAKEVLYDSLQLAHKCILNSFYGYVMRRGSRWFSMEMAGIVCYTGANIITRARELIEQIGRPLELDTDGIWCVLPASFPENLTFRRNDQPGAKVTVSYPGAVLNLLVKESFSNHQYHELKDSAKHTYEVRSENSIFFEVDGPYKCMVLPAAKEEGKKLKKRYAVFNFDGSLAELKGFEVKRRGELELIKIFQSSVFDAFLKGSKLSECYAAVAQVADYWLDVLYSKGADLPDDELFGLISENRSMSRKLEDYGAQKSTSISTAKRLAEFLGDQMVKEAGLACRFVISRKPDGLPVTERAIPLAIFQAEPNVKRHFLRKWLKQPSLNSFDIRDILDWNYYIERLGSAIQKIITIPAALQGESNPVPRVAHPDWLHRKLVDKVNAHKQPKITDLFSRKKKPLPDIEDGLGRTPGRSPATPTATSSASKRSHTGNVVRTPMRSTFMDASAVSAVPPGVLSERQQSTAPDTPSTNPHKLRSWRDVLGPQPPFAGDHEQRLAWLAYCKKKWSMMKQRRKVGSTPFTGGALDTIIRTANDALLHAPWHILQVCETREPGVFRLWVMVGQELYDRRLRVPRIFYVNQRTRRDQDVGEGYRKVNRHLPRSHVVQHLYEHRVDESQFTRHMAHLKAELSTPAIDGIYETQVPLSFRVLAELGCVTRVTAEARRSMRNKRSLDFELNDLEFVPLGEDHYLPDGGLRHLYLYFYTEGTRCICSLLNPSGRNVVVWCTEGKTAPANNVPSATRLAQQYNLRRSKAMQDNPDMRVPKDDHEFEVFPVKSVGEIYRRIHERIKKYQQERHGPTFVAIQAQANNRWVHEGILAKVKALGDMPVVRLHIKAAKKPNLYAADVFRWPEIGCNRMMLHYINSIVYLDSYAGVCRYQHVPLGNVAEDTKLFGNDLMFARHLWRNNHVLWATPANRPDLGGKQLDDARLQCDMMDLAGAGELGSATTTGKRAGINHPTCSLSCVVELKLESLAVSALIQSSRIDQTAGGSFGNSTLGVDKQLQEAATSVSNVAKSNLMAHHGHTTTAQPALRILRNMLHDFVLEIAKHRNNYADDLVTHFYRWLCSPSSLLYEPALRTSLVMLMEKMLLMIVAELRRLGANVIHAAPDRLIISTNKHDAENALSYVKFISSRLVSNVLFAGLHLTVGRAWQMLYWMDTANYGGIRIELDEDGQAILEPESIRSEDDESQQSPSDPSSSVPSLSQAVQDQAEKETCVDMRWQIAEFLPDDLGCQDHFSTVIGGFIVVLYERLRRMRRDAKQGLIPDILEQITASDERAESDDVGQLSERSLTADTTAVTKHMTSVVQELIVDECGPRMMLIISKIQRKCNVVITGSVDAEYDTSALFPILLGSHLIFKSPALELAKAVTQVLLLHSPTTMCVTSMRRDLFRICGMDEFAPDAQWRHPCLSHVLTDVYCHNCQRCRDLDLCRDARNVAEPGSHPVYRWMCDCDDTRPYEFDVGQIEDRLLCAVEQLSLAAVLNDLRCTACHEVAVSNMSPVCECNGPYQTAMNPDALQTRLTLFHNIARLCAMPLLLDVVTWLRADKPFKAPVPVEKKQANLPDQHDV